MSCDPETVFLDNNYTFIAAPVDPDDATGVVGPVVELTGVTGWFTDVPGNAAIAGTTTPLAERAREPGNYFGMLAKAALATALTAYVNTTIYRVVDDGVGNRETVAVPVLPVKVA